MDRKIINILGYLIWIALFVTVIYFLRSWFLGTEIGLPWQISTSYQTQPLLLNYFDIDGEPGGIFVDQILTLQRYFTNDIGFSELDHILLFSAFCTTLILLTAFISFLDRSSYLLAAGAISLMLTQMQLEELLVFPQYLTYAVIGIFLFSSYYFQAFKTEATVTIRLAVSCLAFCVLGAVIYINSPVVNVPVIAMSYGILGPLMLCLLWLLFIAGENIYSIFKITTLAQKGTKAIFHFSLLGLIYVGICFLLFYEKENGLPIELDYLDPRILLILSATSAFYSFQQRHQKYNASIIRLFQYVLYPLGILLILMTYTFGINSLNDSLVDALDWLIIITHMCLGVVYFVYALTNFIPGLLQGLPVWKAFYAGQRTAIITVRLMGFVLCLGSFFYLEYRPFYSAEAAQFNMLGDFANRMGSKDVAKSYYDQAIFNDFNSFKANYTLLHLAESDFDQAEARSRMSGLIKREDHAVGRIKLANDHAQRKRLFQTLETLRSAGSSLNSSKLKNNLGLAYYYYSNYDSAYQQLASTNSEVAEANRWATAFLNKRLRPEQKETAESLGTRVNQQAVANQNGWTQDFIYELRKDTLAEQNDIYFLYNVASSRFQKDYSPILSAIDYYLNNPKNGRYATFLYTAKAMAHYHNGNVNKAFETIDISINRSLQDSGFETFLKAIWCYDQGLEEQTVEYIFEAQRRGYQEDQIKEFIRRVQVVRNYEQKADISQALNDALAQFDDKKKQEALIRVASINAFDASSTLKAIESLQEMDTDKKLIYDLLLQATRLNDQSPPLLKAYILQCEELNLTSFGDTALDKYSVIAPYEDYFELYKLVYQMREEKRAAPIN